MRTMNQEKIERLAAFVNQYARDNNGSSPSLSEIMEYMSMARSTAYRYILELEKRGLVSYSGKNTLSLCLCVVESGLSSDNERVCLVLHLVEKLLHS